MSIPKLQGSPPTCATGRPPSTITLSDHSFRDSDFLGPQLLMSVVHKLLTLCVASSPVLANVPTLRDAAMKHGLLIGAATNVGCLRNTSEPMYISIAHSQFSITTAENSCKVGPIHPYPTTYDFSGCDAIFDSAASAEQRVRGHNLCWHQQNPAWLNSTLSPDELVSALDSHILTVVGRYGDRAYAWDVVNEAVSDGGASQPMLKTECAPFCVRLCRRYATPTD